MTSWRITATNIKFADWRPLSLEFYVFPSLRIHAEMKSFGFWRFDEVALADWIAGKAAMRTTLSGDDATKILSNALPRGAKAEGDIDFAFNPNVEWQARPHDGSRLFLEGRQTDASGIRFRLIEPSASPFAAYFPEPVEQAHAVLAEGRTISGTHAIPLGESADAQVLALPRGPFRIASERRAAGRELALIEGAASIQAQWSGGTDGPLDARIIRRVFSRLNNETTASTAAWIDDGSITVGGVPLVVQSESRLRGDDRVPDVNVESQNNQLKRFELKSRATQHGKIENRTQNFCDLGQYRIVGPRGPRRWARRRDLDQPDARTAVTVTGWGTSTRARHVAARWRTRRSFVSSSSPSSSHLRTISK
jgi:hypothetical protein